jgi:hypothetical protein
MVRVHDIGFIPVAGLPPSGRRPPITGVFQKTWIGEKCDATWRPFHSGPFSVAWLPRTVSMMLSPCARTQQIPTVLDGRPARAE